PDALLRARTGRNRPGTIWRDSARTVNTRSHEVYRRTAIRAGVVSVFADTSKESESVQYRCLERKTDLRTGRLCRLSHAAALHQQQANTGGWIRAPDQSSRTIRYPLGARRARPAIPTSNPPGYSIQP